MVQVFVKHKYLTCHDISVSFILTNMDTTGKIRHARQADPISRLLFHAFLIHICVEKENNFLINIQN